jgi:hypothetical protein
LRYLSPYLNTVFIFFQKGLSVKLPVLWILKFFFGFRSKIFFFGYGFCRRILRQTIPKFFCNGQRTFSEYNTTEKNFVTVKTCALYPNPNFYLDLDSDQQHWQLQYRYRYSWADEIRRNKFSLPVIKMTQTITHSYFFHSIITLYISRNQLKKLPYSVC